MNRRSACLCCLTVAKTSLLSSLVVAAESTPSPVARAARPHWSVNGDWDPDLEEVRQHLIAVHGVNPRDLNLEQMLTLHDTVHRRMGGQGHAHEKSTHNGPKGYRKF